MSGGFGCAGQDIVSFPRPSRADGEGGVVFFDHGFDGLRDLSSDLDIGVGGGDGFESCAIEPDGEPLTGFAFVGDGGGRRDGPRAPFWFASMEDAIAEGELRVRIGVFRRIGGHWDRISHFRLRNSVGSVSRCWSQTRCMSILVAAKNRRMYLLVRAWRVQCRGCTKDSR